MALTKKIFPANNKGLFKIALDEGNLDPGYALELTNARVASNGEVSKRPGRSKLNTVPFSGSPDIQRLMKYEGDFVNTYVVLAQGGTELRKFTVSTGEFDVLVKSGLTANAPLSWTIFNGKMILSNGYDNPFKYFYVQLPVQPTTGQSAGGSMGARTYYVEITYVGTNGETLASERTTQAVSANNLLTVTSPSAASNVTGWNVYVSETSGQEKKQNSSAISIATNWTEPTGGLVDNGSLPSFNTAWVVADLADNPPKGKYCFTNNHRLWMAGMLNEKTRFAGCAVDNEDDWSTANDYVDIDLTGVLSKGDEITGLSNHSSQMDLIIGLKNHIVVYDTPPVYADIDIRQTIPNTGNMSHRGMNQVGNDIYIVGEEGLQSLKKEIVIQGLVTDKKSGNIADLLNPLLKAVTDKSEIVTLNYKQKNFFFIAIPSISRRFLYDYKQKSWTQDKNIKINDMILTPDGEVLSAGDNGQVYREEYDSSGNFVYDDDDSDVSFEWSTPWLWLDTVSLKKILKYFQFKGSGNGQFELEVYFDFETTPYKTIYLQSFPSEWDEVEWDTVYWNFPDINKVLIPMIGRGKAIKFVFKANHKKSLSISFYGVQYKLSGFRSNE